MRKQITLFLCSLCLTSGALFSEEKPRLADFKYNVFSQFGEDGITQQIFDTIGTTSKVVIEFGADDGFQSSNTANLWSKDSSWQGIMIECSDSAYAKLVENLKAFNCLLINRKVGIGQDDTLEAILEDNDIDFNIDLLSIDIDGNDYYIFRSLNRLRPRVIICEYNPTFPADLDVYHDYDVYAGCSVGALIRIGKAKGYSLVAITDTNCFFVRNEDFPKFDAFETQLDKIRINKYLRYIITGYNGVYTVIGQSDFINPYGLFYPSPNTPKGNITVLPNPR